MTLKKFLEKDTYEKLIKYYCNKCDIVMFVTRKDGFSNAKLQELSNAEKEFEEKLLNSLIKCIHRPTWIFHESLCEDIETINKTFNIYFYETTEEVKKYLLSNQDLYSWLNPKYPEDISFFKDGWCYFSTITHEEMCDIYPEDEEEYIYLKNIGVKFLEKEFVPLDKSQMYYEEI